MADEELRNSKLDRRVSGDELAWKSADRQAVLGVALSDSVDYSERIAARKTIGGSRRKRRRRR